MIREWLEQNPDITPEAAAAMQVYADAAAKTGDRHGSAGSGRAIEALDLEQGPAPNL